MEGYKELCRLHIEKQKGFPYPVKYKHKPNSTNGLTRCIVDYVKYMGGHCERTNTMGVWVEPKAKDGIKQKGYYRKTAGTKGSSDVKATYKGMSLYIEVKWGKDKMSEYQNKYADSVTRAGGKYFIAKEFEDFYKWFKQFR